MTLTAKGSYSIPEASRLARSKVNTARYWIAGSASADSGSLLQLDLPRVNGRYALSFLDLIDLHVVARLREYVVSLQSIRRVFEKLSERLNTKHPFSHSRLFTDGRTVFAEFKDTSGDQSFEEILSRQHAISDILKPFLNKIEYDKQTKIASRWNIADGIVIDPDISFGKPVAEQARIATHVLAHSYWANDEQEDLVADIFEVSPDTVRQAVRFESEFNPRRVA